MPPTSVADLKAALSVERERLLAAISGVSEQQFKKRPEATPDDPHPWCIAEVLAHLLHSNGLWAGRIATALADNGASVIATTDAEDDAQARTGRGAPVPQLIHGLLAIRRELDRLIDRALAENGFERYVMHPERGHDSVARMIEEKLIGHEREHVEQILALRSAIGVSDPAGSHDLDGRGMPERTR